MKKILLFIFVFINIIMSVNALTPPSGGVSYYNFSGVSDLWGSFDLINNGATSQNVYPSFNISGDSSPNSFYFTTNDWLETASEDFDFMQNTGNFGVSFWVKLDSVVTDSLQVILDTGGLSSNFKGCAIFYENRVVQGSPKAIRLYCQKGTSGTQAFVIEVDNAITNTDWHHVVVTANASSTDISVFVDGVNMTSTFEVWNGLSSGASNYNLHVGNDGSEGTSFDLNGYLDEVKFFNRSLDDGEVENLFNYGNIIGVDNFTLTSVKSDWDASTITNITMVISGIGTFTNATGNTITTNILSNSTSLYNITLSSPNWFNKIYQNYNVSSNLAGTLNQSVINISPRMNITNITLNNFSITLNGTLGCNVTGSWCLIHPNANIYSYELTSNSGSWKDATGSLTVTALDNKTVYIYTFASTMNITVKNILTNTTINNFTVRITSLNESDDRNYTTTNGTVSVPTLNNTYNVTITEASGYAIFDDDGNYYLNNDSVDMVVSRNLTFFAFTTNSVNIIFRDIETLQIINYTTIYVDLISDLFASNYSTSNGTLYVDLLVPENYFIRYDAEPTYPERFYYLTVNNKTTSNITLYLLNQSKANNITIIVVDENDEVVKNALIKILRYNLASNSYLIQEIVFTNEEGKTNFIGELNEEYYKFVVEYPHGTQVLITEPDYLTDTEITLRIISGDIYGTKYFISIGIFNNVTYNNVTNNFRFDYNDVQNNINGGCLYVYELNYLDSSLYNFSCVSGAVGSILIGVDNSTGKTYRAVGYANIGGELYYLSEKIISFKSHPSEDTKKYRIWLILILTLAMILLTAYEPSIMFIALPIPTFIGSISGFIELNKYVAIGFMVLGAILSYLITKRKD